MKSQRQRVRQRRLIARDTPGIVWVLDEVPAVRFPCWLVTHRELRTSRPMRVVFEALAQGLMEGR